MQRISTVLEVVVKTLESNPPQFVITAKGVVNSGGWTNPTLRPFGTPRNGIEDYEFVASPPQSGSLNTAVMSSIDASVDIGHGSPTANSVRVWSATNNIELTFRENNMAKAVAQPSRGMRAGAGEAGVESLRRTGNRVGGVDAWPWMINLDGGVDVWPWMINLDGGVDALPWSVHAVPRDVPLLLREIIGRKVRVVPFGSDVTQEIQPGRVTIYLNEQGRAFDVQVDPGLDTA
jgi:hypothetical protein